MDGKDCWQQAGTDQGQELRCDLRRNHKTDHYDAALGLFWSVDQVTTPWPMLVPA